MTEKTKLSHRCLLLYSLVGREGRDNNFVMILSLDMVGLLLNTSVMNLLLGKEMMVLLEG